MITKDKVTEIWEKCQLDLCMDFPEYHTAIEEYKLVFGRKRRAYGTCKYRTKTIEIHMYLCKHVEVKDLKDTILHEMAHAIDKEVNGYCSGHGNNWKRIARRIGANPKSSSSKGNGVIKKSKYIMVLLNEDGSFEYISPKHRKSRNITLNQPIYGTYLTGRKKETLNKLSLISWDKFINEYKSGNIDTKSKEIDKTINF